MRELLNTLRLRYAEWQEHRAIRRGEQSFDPAVRVRQLVRARVREMDAEREQRAKVVPFDPRRI